MYNAIFLGILCLFTVGSIVLGHIYADSGATDNSANILLTQRKLPKVVLPPEEKCRQITSRTICERLQDCLWAEKFANGSEDDYHAECRYEPSEIKERQQRKLSESKIMKAVQSCEVTELRKSLQVEKGNRALAFNSEESWTPLTWASLGICTTAGEFELGNPPRQTTPAKVNPNKYAITMIRMLIDAGADVNARQREGYTALMFASGASLLRDMKSSGINMKNNLRIEREYTANLKKIVLELLKLKPKINAKSKDGMTALHMAARSGQTEVVKLLLKAGADRNAKNQNGKTPADLAEESGFKKLAKELRLL